MLSCGKVIIVNFTLLSYIDNRKPTSESGAAYVFHFLFLAFFLGQPCRVFILPKAGRLVNFLVVQTTVNFKQWAEILLQNLKNLMVTN